MISVRPKCRQCRALFFLNLCCAAGEDPPVGEIRPWTPRSCSRTKFANSFFVGMLRTNGLSTDFLTKKPVKWVVRHTGRSAGNRYIGAEKLETSLAVHHTSPNLTPLI